MAPIEPRRRVKSIKTPGDKRITKKTIPRWEINYSRAYLIRLLKKVLKRRVNSYATVNLLCKTYRRIIKMACELVARRHRRITIKRAQIVISKLIPREVANAAIREFHRQRAENARFQQSVLAEKALAANE